jgi:hypothetical protein
MQASDSKFPYALRICHILLKCLDGKRSGYASAAYSLLTATIAAYPSNFPATICLLKSFEVLNI